jgi:hypothetical protein
MAATFSHLEGRYRMHPVTHRFSDVECEEACQGSHFSSTYHLTITVIGLFLTWHLLAPIFLEGADNVSKISVPGSALFLAARSWLHSFPDQVCAHSFFSCIWTGVLVSGHAAFIVGFWTEPRTMDTLEAVGTAFIWMLLITLQHIFLLDFIHRAAVILSILAATLLCPGYSQIERGQELALFAIAAAAGEALGQTFARMLRMVGAPPALPTQTAPHRQPLPHPSHASDSL